MVSPRLLVLSSLVLLASLAATTPVKQVPSNFVRLPIAKRLNLTGSAQLLQHDQARLRGLRAHAALLSGTPPPPFADAGSIPAQNQAVQYVANASDVLTLLLGLLAHQVALDSLGLAHLQRPTNSSSIPVAPTHGLAQAAPLFRHPQHAKLGIVWSAEISRSTPPPSADEDANVPQAVTYDIGDSAHMSGNEFTDNVFLASGFEIQGQSLGVAVTSSGFAGVDGVLGLGPTELTLGTLSPDTLETIPTVTDMLFVQGDIPEDVVAISFEPTQSPSVVNGELTFGGTDPTKFIGEVGYVPITTTSPSSEFFGVDLCLRYGLSTMMLAESAGIVDSGSTLLLIPTDSLEIYVDATGAVLDANTGLYRLTLAQFATLESIFLAVGGAFLYEFTANAQIWPRALNSLIGGSPDFVYLIVGDIGNNAGSGLDVALGMTFLERFYTVLDSTQRRVGIANTSFTTATTN